MPFTAADSDCGSARSTHSPYSLKTSTRAAAFGHGASARKRSPKSSEPVYGRPGPTGSGGSGANQMTRAGPNATAVGSGADVVAGLVLGVADATGGVALGSPESLGPVAHAPTRHATITIAVSRTGSP